MDRVDFRILAALHEDGLLSQAAIGRRVGLSGPAVANRLKRLRGDGILLGFRADIHPSVFGRKSTMHVLPGPFKARDVERALGLENVVWVAWKMDGGMTAMAYGPTDLSSLGDVETRISGDGRTTKPPSRLARRVLAATVRDPRAGRDVLAERTGLSPKTCAKHRDAAIAQKDLTILPRLGALHGEGAIVYHAAVFGGPSTDAVGAALKQAILIDQASDVQYWFCMAPDLISTRRRHRDVAALGAKLRVTMNRTLVQNDERLVTWLSPGASFGDG